MSPMNVAAIREKNDFPLIVYSCSFTDIKGAATPEWMYILDDDVMFT
jgi:hypothetical protein